MKATRQDALQLLHEGAVALSKMEHNGVRVDVDYLNHQNESIGTQIKEINERLKANPIFKTWRKHFGDRTKLSSREQLGKLLFDVMKIESGGYTEKSKDAKKKRYKVDEEVLEKLDIPFVKDFIQVEKLKKLKGTYIEGVLGETIGQRFHSSYNQHIPISYRSSCDSPNFQNFPVRDPFIGKIIRQAIIPSKGNWIVEADLKGAEVCVAGCQTLDERLIDYIKDPSKDMHRDMAGQLFKLKKAQIPKSLRQAAKTYFTFAQFYGDWWKSCAKHLWDEAGAINLETGETIHEWLSNQGIDELGNCDPNEGPEVGTFEAHVKAVEHNFWSKRFKGYNQWKRDWYDKYLTRGWFPLLTGFRCVGVYGRKEVCNYPIQGASYHLILWSLIRLHKWIEKHGLKTRIIGTIHDSLILDVPQNELQDVMAKLHRIMKVELPRAWDWIIVPLTVEIEGSEENWFNKKPLEMAV